MIGPNDLKPGTFFVYEGQPYEVQETHHLKMQQRRPVVQTKMKNLLNGKNIEHNFAQSDLLEEADIQRQSVRFLFKKTSGLPAGRQGEYWFSDEHNPSKRFQLAEEFIGSGTKFLKSNCIVEAITWNDKIINVELPVKMDFKVIEAPPAIRGNTAQGGVKQVKIETGAIVNVPLFINEGDIIRLNTHEEQYTERISKK